MTILIRIARRDIVAFTLGLTSGVLSSESDVMSRCLCCLNVVVSPLQCLYLIVSARE